jgi:hypothetical protein
MKYTWILVLSVALVGCGKKADNKTDDTTKPTDKPADKPGDKPAEPPADKPAGATTLSSDEYESTRKRLADQMTGIFKSDGTDCDKIGADVSKMDYDAIASIKAFEKAHPDVKAKHQADDAAISDLIMPAVKACGKNPAFMDAFKKMNQR